MPPMLYRTDILPPLLPQDPTDHEMRVSHPAFNCFMNQSAMYVLRSKRFSP